ncbi:hypothetical protein F5883DRAFT_692133 [Diaporthe sp. PMI_573]|nr:hypothetical protein F5883DRAFT_692133 [Diaporthaceae sp. PMI_573]
MSVVLSLDRNARNQALSYLGKSDPPGCAEGTTFTTDGTNLNLYAHYAAPSDDSTLKYHQYRYASANVKDTYQGHKDGRRGIRNEQDHARDQSCDLRDQLKEHWKQRCRGLQPIVEGVPLPLPDATFEETSAYEDEAGYEIVATLPAHARGIISTAQGVKLRLYAGVTPTYK